MTFVINNFKKKGNILDKNVKNQIFADNLTSTNGDETPGSFL